MLLGILVAQRNYLEALTAAAPKAQSPLTIDNVLDRDTRARIISRRRAICPVDVGFGGIVFWIIG
jgi:hypothetical protein